MQSVTLTHLRHDYRVTPASGQCSHDHRGQMTHELISSLSDQCNAMLPILKDVRRNILNFKCRLNRKIDDFPIESILWQECDSNNNVFKVVCVFWNILLFSSTIKIFQFTPLRLYFSPGVLSVWQCNFLQNITHSPTLNNILTLNSLLLSLKASTEHEETWWRLFEIKCKHANILF